MRVARVKVCSCFVVSGALVSTLLHVYGHRRNTAVLSAYKIGATACVGVFLGAGNTLGKVARRVQVDRGCGLGGVYGAGLLLSIRHAANMQAAFEERLLRLHQTETDGVRVALANGIPLRKGCILYYPASHHWEQNGYVDFCGDYPALLYMDGATSAELYRTRHRTHLLQMPVWPAEGAVRVVDDIVIIKGPEI